VEVVPSGAEGGKKGAALKRGTLPGGWRIEPNWGELNKYLLKVAVLRGRPCKVKRGSIVCSILKKSRMKGLFSKGQHTKDD